MSKLRSGPNLTFLDRSTWSLHHSHHPQFTNISHDTNYYASWFPNDPKIFIMAIWTVSSSQEQGLPRSKFVSRPLDITWLYPRAVSCGSYSWSQILGNYSAIIAISKSLEEPADQRKQFFSLSLKQNDPRFRLENWYWPDLVRDYHWELSKVTFNVDN